MDDTTEKRERIRQTLKRLKAHKDGYSKDLPRSAGELSEEVRILYTILGHVLGPNQPFICGSSTNDHDGMPDRLIVCRALGSDWLESYTRNRKPDTTKEAEDALRDRQ